MGYRIQYPGDKPDPAPPREDRRFRLTMLILGIFLLLTVFFWPEGREVLRIALIPGDADSMLQAAEVFAREIGNGDALFDAVNAFCHSVLTYGHSD